MEFAFLKDLDDWFCETYADYDKICILKGYVMPKMQATKRLEDGRDYSYTLPADTMRLALQSNREELLRQLKETLQDKSFSFSFRPLGFFARIRDKFSKNSFSKTLTAVLRRYNETTEEAKEKLDVSEKTWKRICKGRYYPTKNLLFSLALATHMKFDDIGELMGVCGFTFDYTDAKDVVVAYLITNKVFNADMVRAALAEYKISNLFLKEI